MLIPTVLVSGLHVNPTWQTTSTNPTLLNQFDLITETTGWVLLDGQLFWTSDGGQSWDEIGPSIPVDAAVQDVQFFDSNTGWILWMTPNSDGSSSFTIAHTNDQGANWSTITPSLFDSGDVASHAAKAQMGWFDAQTGWIAVKQSSSSNFSVGTLFTTSDAGKTWTRSILPVADRVTFSNPQLGWASGSPTGDQIFRTQNGGRTWHSTKPDLPLNAAATAYEPFFTNGRGSVVITSVAEEGLALRAFSASSNGWLPMGQVTVKTQAGTIGLSMIDAQNFVAVIPGTNSIVRMHNGSFETLANQDGLSATIRDLDMASLDVGWAKSVDSECTTAFLDNGSASVSCTSSTRLLRTQDGGVTWKDIQLPVVNGNAATGASELSQPLAVSSIPNVGNTEVFIGQGFDICEVPTISQLQTWSTSSPYKVINLYIGGSSRACLNTALTSTYLKKMYHQGWKFIPTWVGPQAPCTGYSSRISSDVGTAYNQGTSEANLAAERLAELGLTYPDKTKSAVYYDIEHYGTNTTCREAVKAFMNGWVSQLHARGNIAGVYGSTLCNTGLSDFLTNANVPDTIWAARWYHNLGQGYYDPTATVWNLGSCISNTVWSNHQRIRQYEGEHEETWGDLTLGIDSNVLDAVVAIPYPDPARISFQELVSGLNNPVFVTNANDGSGRLFVVERSGFIRIIKNGTLLTTPFLDIHSIVQSAGGEQGLLGLAFHPSYGTNGKFYVAYTAPRDGDTTGSVLTLKQYSVSAGNPDLANAAGGNTVLTIDHPTYSNHNGGALAFGNDGYLYWSTGDGGGAGDPNNNAQNLTRLLGKILRVNVNAGSPYSIPSSNPFYGSADTSIKKEIWAYGLRNPWRISFDRATHDLYIGDVGQGVREEIDFQPASSGGGQNYGWRIMEGSLCYNPASGCDQTGKVLPIAEYDHTLGCSVTGGYVYRGSNSPSLSGYYLYGDYCSGRVFTVHKTSPTSWSTPVQLADTAFNITSFGEDEQGELYLADYATGKIYKIKYAEPYYLIHGNAGAAGVTLSYVDGTTKTITSQPDGNYSIQVPGGWSGTITPAKTCYTFNPPNRSYSTISENQIGQNYVATFNNASGCANVSVSMGGSLLGQYGVPAHRSTQQTYDNIDNGPLKITSSDGIQLISSEQINLKTNAAYTSYTELMGIPASKLTDTYIFPWYNNADAGGLSSQLRFGNVGNVTTTVTIKIGGVTQPTTYTLAPNESARVSLDNIDNGPVEVKSSGGVSIIASMRINLKKMPAYSSYTEFLGLSASSTVGTKYTFPWYNNANAGGLSSQLRFGNVGNAHTTVTIKVAGVTQPQTYTLAPNGSARVELTNVDSGPVEVFSSAGVPIIASQRINLKTNPTYSSYSELMGLPSTTLSETRYLFPWYNNANSGGLSSQLRFANVGNASTVVSIKIGGVTQPQTYTLAPNGSARVELPNVDNGPVEVFSNGQPIIASIRV
ncbi:MAG TPA: PQQ-dependent sugar dehydrogenase, partial [Anaerolineales bacterium]|nr:PQQ-dependent sugar dehydrogenase [Anaerolineales bacterium]